MSGRALITGVVGQDGSYLAELLLDKGYIVRGITRRASYPHTQRIDHLFARYDDRDPQTPFRVTYADLTDSSSLQNVLHDFEPTEVYNLASQSHVGISFDTGESTLDINAIGHFRLLNSLRKMGARDTRYYQASSSEMYGSSPPPQNEDTRFYPQSPYAVSKIAAFHLTRMHRIAYGMFASNGILFNHESPRRGLNFVTRKVTLSIAKLLSGEIDSVEMGNLDARRDWGFAGDYVDAIHRIVRHTEPDDFVVATGISHPVRDFVALAFSLVGLDWQDFVTVSDRFKRPADSLDLLGDASKARRLLGWAPKVGFEELCAMLLESDLHDYGFSMDTAKAKAATLTRRNRKV